MPESAEVAELSSTIEESARLLDVPLAPDRVRAILSAYADAFAHPGSVVAFRVATKLRHVAELDCRFRTHPDTRDPYAVALFNGLTEPTDHPAGTLAADVRRRFTVESHGIDFGVAEGFRKIYVAFTPDHLQKAVTLAQVPSMPPAMAANLELFERHGLADRVAGIAIDYPSRTVNVYFNELPAACYEPETIRRVLREIGTVAPSDQMLKLGERAFGLYVTLGWDSPAIARVCYAAATTDLTTLPIPVEPEIEKFVQSVPHGGEDRKFVYGVALAPQGEYYKLESHHRWRPGSLNFI